MGLVAKCGAWIWLGLLCVGCGRSTLEPGWSWGDEGAAGGPMQAAGNSSSAGSGGFGVSGTGTGFGGFPMIAGTSAGGGVPVGGGGMAGNSGALCELTKGDCRVAEPNCEQTNELCTGELLLAKDYRSERAAVTALTASPNGVVTAAGYFEGPLDLGGVHQLEAVEGSDSFVVGFSVTGTTQWASSFGDIGTQAVSGIDFTTNGEHFLQGIWDDGPLADPGTSPGMAYTARVNPEYEFTSFVPFATTNPVRPGSVEVDNNGAVFLAGWFVDDFALGGEELSCAGECGYLAKLASDGTLLWLEAVRPDGWSNARITRVVADDEDNVIVIGDRGDTGNAAFFQKRSSNGQLVFTQGLTTTSQVQLRALVVDRQMRITVGGSFSGNWQAGDLGLQGSSNVTGDAWVAQFSSAGALIWAHAYSSQGKGARVTAAALDPYGNLVLAGLASYLDVAGEVIDPVLHNVDGAAFVLKLRSSGSKVWLRPFYGGALPQLALTADNRAHVWLGGSFASAFQIGEGFITPLGRDAFLFRLSP